MKKEFYKIANLVTKNAKILDVGCGNGELMKYITENISKKLTKTTKLFFINLFILFPLYMGIC